MRSKTYTLTGIATSATGVAAAQATTAGTALTLQAAAASLDPPRFLLFTGSAAITGTLTVVGLDRWGHAQTEVISGVTAVAVQSKGVYSKVTSITPSDTDADTVSVGWPAGAVSPWIICGRRMGTDAVPEALVSALATGAADGQIDVTYSQFPTLSEPSITIDQSILAASFTPGTPQAVKGQGVRFILTTGSGTSVVLTVTRPG